MGGRGLTPWRIARIWIADYLYAGVRQLAVLTAWRRPMDWLSGDDRLPDVILVPGVYEHWTFLRPLGARLHRAGFRVRTVHGLGVNRRPIPGTAERLGRALGRLPVPAAGRVVVGHSKGGLIGKHLVVDDLDSRALGLIGVVAVASPFAGTRLATLLLDPSVREFLPDGPAIVALGDASSVNGSIVSVFGPFDPHIPDGSALDGATNVEVATPGHFRLLGAPATADAVIEGIRLLIERSAPSGPSSPEAT
ncbi:triacylglycerol lipase [Agromyces sp. LHK192]|uniref:esterase/lipase family protein n=1 Tax=Agromyces sp. LHK192 TaxID=2498704 RepID=UPI000FD86A96|nr:hypothetical protein [Agromyces sp. LHK192]